MVDMVGMLNMFDMVDGSSTISTPLAYFGVISHCLHIIHEWCAPQMWLVSLSKSQFLRCRVGIVQQLARLLGGFRFDPHDPVAQENPENPRDTTSSMPFQPLRSLLGCSDLLITILGC